MFIKNNKHREFEWHLFLIWQFGERERESEDRTGGEGYDMQQECPGQKLNCANIAVMWYVP